MKYSSIVVNSFNKTPYMVSTIYSPKQAILRSDFLGSLSTDTYFESAVFQVSRTKIGLLDIFKMIIGGPQLVFNSMAYSLEDTKEGGEKEFHKLVCTMIENEKIEDLVKETDTVFDKYGYLDHQQNIWSLWQLRKIKHIFLQKHH